MASWAQTRAKIIQDIKYTMEDYTKWREPNVAKWTKDLARGSQVLTKYLHKNMECLAETTGADLTGIDNPGLADLGINYNSREQIMLGINDLRENEKSNVERRAKAERLKKAFLNSDIDNSGTVEDWEIKDVVRQIFPQTSDAVMRVYYNVLLRECDTDGSGIIPLSALQQGDHNTIMMKVMHDADQAELIESKFNEIDADGSGELDPQEMKALTDRCFSDSGATVRRKMFNAVIKDCDKNNDGTVSLEEFLSSKYLSLLVNLPAANSAVTHKDRGVNIRCTVGSPRRQDRAGISSSLIQVNKPHTHAESFEVHGDHFGVEPDVLVNKAEELLDQNQSWIDAESLFLSAAAAYRYEDNFLHAGQAYQRAADCQLKLYRWLEATTSLSDAADCYKMVSVEDAASCLHEVVDILVENKRYKKAAQVYVEIGNMYSGVGDMENAIDYFREAVNHFDKTKDWQEICKCLHNILELYSRLQMYSDAQEVCTELKTLIQNSTRTLNNKIDMSDYVVSDYNFYGLLLAVADLDQSNAVLRHDQLETLQKRYNALPICTTRGPNATLFVKLQQAVRENNELLLVNSLNTYCDGKSPPVPDWVITVFRAIKANLRSYAQKTTEHEPKYISLF